MNATGGGPELSTANYPERMCLTLTRAYQTTLPLQTPGLFEGFTFFERIFCWRTLVTGCWSFECFFRMLSRMYVSSHAVLQ